MQKTLLAKSILDFKILDQKVLIKGDKNEKNIDNNFNIFMY